MDGKYRDNMTKIDLEADCYREFLGDGVEDFVNEGMENVSDDRIIDDTFDAIGYGFEPEVVDSYEDELNKRLLKEYEDLAKQLGVNVEYPFEG